MSFDSVKFQRWRLNSSTLSSLIRFAPRLLCSLIFILGKNKAIVDNPIVLTVHSYGCPDLTLIDLPGITRVPLKGSDQTDDVEKVTRDMASRYAKDPRTIVLAVVPANVDMSTSDALQLARKVDPKGVRTIGVVTKVRSNMWSD